MIGEYESRYDTTKPMDRRERLQLLEERRQLANSLVPPGPGASWSEKKRYAILRAYAGPPRAEPYTEKDLDEIDALDRKLMQRFPLRLDPPREGEAENPSVLIPLGVGQK